MNEKQLIAAITKKLPKTIHQQSMTMGSLTMNGTPDRYFDGPKADIWIEFKMRTTIAKGLLVLGGVEAGRQGAYSPLQFAWMCRRYAYGGNVVGIIGLPDKRVAIQTTPKQWEFGSPLNETISIPEATKWIINYCGQ